MRSYGAAALLLLAIVTECLSAERSRQRSGPIRSVPIAANVKRDVDFDCPEEFGYYPHPTDCTLYYVCVFGGALLESCTGGLMYSHELQTCDWPRNVGCDGASAAGGEEIERLTERDRRLPPPPPPRRTQTPPPLQAQPKPVITSRGQPKFNRAEYEKQQQLYAEVDDLPPVEEIESDRQQRVYRGQPSTIGQVQKDRDGYATLLGGSTRNFNSNIIPASISHNSKLGSFSVGTQVEDRRTATTIAPPHSYNGNEILTDSHHDRHIDIDSNDIDDTKDKTLSRRKRDVVEISKSENKTDKPDEISNKNDESMEYYDVDFDDSYLRSLDDNERGKRQVRFYVKNNNPGYKTSGKNWVSSKPIKFLEYIQSNRHPINQNSQHVRYPQLYNNNNNYYDNNRRPSHESESYSPTKSLYLRENSNQRPFKASLPDLSNNHNPLNIATQIITKSPPISALIHNENQYSSGNYHSGATNGYQTSNKYSPVTFQPSPQVSYKDSSLLPSTVVTGKPVPSSTYPAVKTQNKRPTESEEEYEDTSYEDYSSEEDKNDDHEFRPPYEFTHPHKDKFLNPFANPNFDFDAFLEKLSDGDYRTQKANQPTSPRTNTSKTTYVDYKGMSTPTPFGGQEVTIRPGSVSEKYIHDRPLPNTNSFHQNQQIIENQNIQQQLSYAQSIGPALDAVKLKIKPPNFNDDRQLPISYSFGRLIDIPSKNENHKEEQKSYPVTQKPYNILLTATASPIVFSSPKHQYYINSDKVISLRPYVTATSKPYSGSSETPKEYLVYKHTTPNPATTLTNKQLHILQQFWKNASTEKAYPQHVTARPSTTPDIARLKNLFAQAIASSPRPQTKNQSPINYNQVSTTIKPTTKRRPIPKPSPEMNDYYYDEEEYYEPLVKPKYMPSTEIKPQRPFMAQNYKQYDDNFDTLIEQIQPQRQTKNANEFATNSKEHNQSNKGKIPVPVYVDFISSTPASIKRPNISNIEIINRTRNKTTPFRKPNYENGPNTVRPPKFLNQTTLRPYTVRHRLAKPTIAIDTDYSLGQQKEKPRHKNIVAQMLTTPRDSHNQETRYTKSKHDGRTNSLEPTESMPYSPSPKPKMLYNGSQTYSSDQYDPYYAVYEDEAELYKDTEYVHYNMGSARPAVQTIQGNAPPPVRNPIDFTAYSLRPTSANEDYDNILLQGQMRDQNQYRTPNRQANRGDGNELGYDHHPISVKTTIYEATPISTTYRTTSTSTTQRPTTTTASTTTTTTARTTTAPVTEAMTPTRYNSRPTSTRGRGSAHYSTLSGNEAPQTTPNRGTPPTRSRPTLKPSTAIVSKSTEFSDIYAYPPSRPAPVYPQPIPDKTAAKCRKDVCLLPDCYCGGKEIPGDLPVEQVPQIVLLTFDDSVNDLNKVLYTDLFEKGRVNPNGCPISATFYVSHEWTDYSQVQNLYSAGHEMASHTISHSFGEQFSQKKWNREVGGQREILAAYGGVKLEDVRGMRAPFLSIGGNKMFKMLYDSNFTYDSSMPVYENRPPSWPYTLDYKLFHDCMIPPCPTKSYPGVWEVPMVMWQDLNGGRCSMGDACANPPEADGVYKMLLKNFDRHYTTNRAPFGLYYHAAWFTQPHHKEGFIKFLDFINRMDDVWIVTNWQALQWVRDPTPINRLNSFQPFQCNYQDRPKKCNNPKVCNLWHKSGVRYMRTCQPCPEVYPWTGKTGIRSSRIDNDNGE